MLQEPQSNNHPELGAHVAGANTFQAHNSSWQEGRCQSFASCSHSSCSCYPAEICPQISGQKEGKSIFGLCKKRHKLVQAGPRFCGSSKNGAKLAVSLECPGQLLLYDWDLGLSAVDALKCTALGIATTACKLENYLLVWYYHGSNCGCSSQSLQSPAALLVCLTCVRAASLRGTSRFCRRLL